MKIKTIILSVLLLASLASAQDTLKVLFLGNSYTASHNLPQLFTDLSASGNHPVYTGANTPGGYKLEDHCENTQSIALIEEGIWDYVTLQEQSQVPSIDYWRYNSMYPSAEILDSLITASGAQTCFFMTWGRKRGGQQSIGGYSSPVFADFFHMQDSLTSAYTEISQMLGAELSPVGLSWAMAVTLDPYIDLWDPDLSHPTLLGSYLAACTFYGVLFGESPVGITFTAGLTPEQAEFLQMAADMTLGVDDNLPNSPPKEIILLGNYPNPFNASTTIPFLVNLPGKVTLRIYNNLGREVWSMADVSWQMSVGEQRVVWNAEGKASGVYIVRLDMDCGESAVRKAVLLK